MKLSHHQYYSPIIGLLTASVLLSLSTGNVLADADMNQPLPHPTVSKGADHSNGQITTKEVTRTINYVDPLTKEKHTIKQVVRFDFDHDGEVIKGPAPVWQAYFAPYFEGYTPNQHEINPKLVTPDTVSETENITYEKKPSTEICIASVKFTPIDGTEIPLNSRHLMIKDPTGQPLSTFELPTPPAGWEYVGKNQLPKVLRVYSSSNKGVYFDFLVQRSDSASKQERSKEKRLLSRRIILHLPTGDRIITQFTHAIRDVVTANGKTHYGEWQISPFDELALPQVDGYDSSLPKIDALQLTADQLDKKLDVINVNYHETSSDEKHRTTPPKDASATNPVPDVNEGKQTDSPGMKDDNTQTEQPVKVDEGSQTDTVPTTDTGVGDDTVETTDQGTQTAPVAGKDESTQTDPETGKDESIQTDPVAGKDESTQTEQPVKVDEGSQTAAVSTADTGVGEDTIETTNQGTQTVPAAGKDESVQTDPVAGKDETTQTVQPVKTDEESQTDTVSTTDTGVGEDTVEETDQGTQTAPVTGKDETTQTTQPVKTDEGSQTDTVPTADTGVGEDTIETTDQGTQTALVAGKDESTQTTQPAKTDEGSQTDTVPTVDTGVGEDTVEATDQGTQTEDHSTTDTGVGDNPATNADKSTQTTLPVEHEAQLTAPVHSDTENTEEADQHSANNHDQTGGQDASTSDAGHGNSLNSDEVIPTDIKKQTTADTIDPIAFHDEVDQLQRPLKELSTGIRRHRAASLPQTGNQTDYKITLAGMIMALTGAILAALHLQKRH
ncbi:MAG: LPXTG cell wall anchor domain-containing protein [Limosilactobacillus sp.]